MNRNYPSCLVLALLLGWFALTSAELIDLTRGGIDLGRHLKNGELLLTPAAPQVLHTNFYSYTQPELEFVNHHWLAGVVFFAAWKLGGFSGLNAFYILLGALALFLLLRMAQRAAGLAMASALALALMPILRLRASVRPEIFTILLGAVFFWFLWKHHEGSFGLGALLVLPALEILWVNLHIGFIFGPIFIGAFLIGELLERRRVGALAGVLALSLLATLANPSGVEGAIYPFSIWTNYGMSMIENQSVWFLARHGYEGEFALIGLTMLVMYLSFIPASKRAKRFPMALFILAAVIGEMAFSAIRNQTLLAFFAIPVIAINAGPQRRKAWLAAVLLVAIAYNGRELFLRRETLGLGLTPGVDSAARFFAANRLQGPLLNNLNISGYLIYYLFPQQRVYVDSRPEAYSAAFLQDQYRAPLTDETLWPRLDQYAFNTIFFSWSSLWENQFLTQRALDPAWAAVFADKTGMILVRRSAANRAVIERYEIPREKLLRK